MSNTAGENGETDISPLDETRMSPAEELQKLQDLIKLAEEDKSRLILQKAESEKEKRTAQEDLERCMEADDEQTKQFQTHLQQIQEEVKSLDLLNRSLQRELQDLREKLQIKTDEIDCLQQKFKIQARIPVKALKFCQCVEVCEDEESVDRVSSVFTVTQKPSFLLRAGQALITFEEEKVAEQILRLAKCSVACDKAKMDVKPYALTLDPSVKFEVHICVSKRTVCFSGAVSSLPEERMRERLELCFSRPSRGGGEVEKLEYDGPSGSGRVSFLSSGVAENLVLRGKFCVDIGSDKILDIQPLYEYHLKKFQTYSGTPNRTVLLGGIQALMDEEDLQDHLEIHFQKPSNYGGEVEHIRYVADGKQLTAFFSEDASHTHA